VSVLIVDNDPGVRALLAELLRRKGLLVETADDGVEAWQRLEQDPPVQVLVCDLDMPRMNGGELLQRLHDAERQPATVVVSGFLDEAQRRVFGERGWIRSVLRKPFDVMAFAGLVVEMAGDYASAEEQSAVPTPGNVDLEPTAASEAPGAEVDLAANEDLAADEDLAANEDLAADEDLTTDEDLAADEDPAAEEGVA
jgi:CheY-like chemotaxis protein